MKIEKAIIQIKLLQKRVSEYKKAAFFGVQANNPEAINLWSEYNTLRTTLSSKSEIFGDLREINLPAPKQASSFSHHDVGTLVYYPNDFDALENEIEKAVEYISLLKENQSENKVQGDIHISASTGSLVNLTIGNNNKVLQNTGQIDKVLEEIENLGVDKSELSSLKEIINQNARGEETKIHTGKRILIWIGSLTKKLIEKGLTENIPTIIEKAQSLTDLI